MTNASARPGVLVALAAVVIAATRSKWRTGRSVYISDNANAGTEKTQLFPTTSGMPLPPEKRSILLERVAARLDLNGPAFTDSDVEAAIASAMRGLLHDREPTA